MGSRLGLWREEEVKSGRIDGPWILQIKKTKCQG